MERATNEPTTFPAYEICIPMYTLKANLSLLSLPTTERTRFVKHSITLKILYYVIVDWKLKRKKGRETYSDCQTCEL